MLEDVGEARHPAGRGGGAADRPQVPGPQEDTRSRSDRLLHLVVLVAHVVWDRHACRSVQSGAGLGEALGEALAVALKAARLAHERFHSGSARAGRSLLRGSAVACSFNAASAPRTPPLCHRSTRRSCSPASCRSRWRPAYGRTSFAGRKASSPGHLLAASVAASSKSSSRLSSGGSRRVGGGLEKSLEL